MPWGLMVFRKKGGDPYGEVLGFVAGLGRFAGAECVHFSGGAAGAALWADYDDISNSLDADRMACICAAGGCLVALSRVWLAPGTIARACPDYSTVTDVCPVKGNSCTP